MKLKWYKQFWPWFLIALPGSVVVASMVTIYISALDPDGLVRGDYYKNGLAINENIGRQLQASELGLVAQLQTQGEVLLLQLRAHNKDLHEAHLILQIVHPTRSGQDREVVMQHEGDGHYRAALPRLHQGAWNLMLQPLDRSWRLEGRIHWPLKETKILSAK